MGGFLSTQHSSAFNNCHWSNYRMALCLTNIDIVYGINCFQVFQHESGSEIYLRVTTGSTNWGIGPTIDGSWKDDFFDGISSGSSCPANPTNSVNVWTGAKCWKYSDNGVFKEGILTLSCSTHFWAFDWNKYIYFDIWPKLDNWEVQDVVKKQLF